MCVVSMITDHYSEKWTPLVPQHPAGWQGQWNVNTPIVPVISPEEVAEFRRLLERAREYDARNHEPACESAEKVSALKVIAKALGIDISFVTEGAA